MLELGFELEEELVVLGEGVIRFERKIEGKCLFGNSKRGDLGSAHKLRIVLINIYLIRLIVGVYQNE